MNRSFLSPGFKLAACCLLLLACGTSPRPVAAPAQPLSIRTQVLIVRDDTAHVEVAATEEMRQVGLMFRTAMGENDGMLFVFDSVFPYRFWMRNTELPLSIAFIKTDGEIADIQDMAPHDEETHHESPAPVLYALEMNQGWFAKRGIKAGYKLGGAPFKPRG